MPSRNRPQTEFWVDLDEEEDFLALEGCWSVKSATPAVTRPTTRYLYNG